MTFSESEVEPAWPTLDELKQWRDIAGSEWDGAFDLTRFSAELAAAIEYVKLDIGLWDELSDLPNVKQARAAMRMAVMMRENAGIDPVLLSKDAVYRAYLKGERRRFAIA